MRKIKEQKGFTLLETVLYIALLAILVGGGMVGVYNILEGSGRTRQAMYREQESYFISRKIDAVVYDSTNISSPAANQTSTSLETNDAEITLDAANEQILISRGGADPVPLNSSLVSADSLLFERNTASGTITAAFSLDGQEYYVSNYYYE